MTVYRLMSAGELPAVRVGRSYRLGEEDIDSYRPASFIEAG
jgi:excisionase family DNA binding protein